MTTTKFKNTEIGLIPEDWEVLSLGDIGDVRMCKRILKHQTSSVGDIPFYKIGTFGKEPDAFISRELFEEYRRLYNYPKQGDVLLSAAGTIGRTVLFDGKDAYFQDSNIVWIENNERKLLNGLLYYIYNKINWVADTGTIPRIYNDIVRKIFISFPPTKEEQSRIATALYDIDTLIRNLDRTIEKKKNIRQGAMEQLLSGKKRLPGFKGEWIDFNLGQFGRMVRGVSFKPEQSHNIRSNNSSILLRSTNVQDGRIFMGEVIYVDNNCIRSEQIMKQGDILICTANGSRALVGKSALFLEKKKCTFGAFMSVFRCDEVQFSSFIYYLFQSSTYRRMLEDILSGSAINNLNASQVEELVFNVPANSDELFAIADTLTAMDDEIAVLQMERDKYANIRSGMMDDLLTGAKRL